eukprot:1496018-Amphidinium_carterae.1
MDEGRWITMLPPSEFVNWLQSAKLAESMDRLLDTSMQSPRRLTQRAGFQSPRVPRPQSPSPMVSLQSLLSQVLRYN